MGWTWYEATHYKNGKVDRKAECDAYFTEGFNKGWYKVERSTLIGTVYYAAIRKLKTYSGKEIVDIPESEQIVFGVVFLTSTDAKSYYNFGYKDMDETVGPGYYDCPVRILDLLSPIDSDFANEWRRCCRERAKAKKAEKTDPNSLDNLPIGTIIKCGDVKLEKSEPMAQFKRPFWLVVGKYQYYTKKQIKYKGYEVLLKPSTVA